MTRKYQLLLATLVALFVVTRSLNVLNQCPQPTETNPNPGVFYYGHPEDCRFYITCSEGKPQPKQCKPSGRATYSDFYHTCVGLNSPHDTCTRLNAQRECKRGMSGLIGHSTKCHRFYNCSQNPRRKHAALGDFEDECSYPKLFDIEIMRCTSSKDATCGSNRKLPKDPCELQC